jgi:pimeloyl-ACP methyl ester carboxylesterase
MAERMRDLYPAAKRVGLDAGHCPHDEVPDAVNSELLQWIEETSI